jgi:hypothetical protein
MGSAHPAVTNFTAGELSPRLAGRVDLEKYYNGARTLTNITVHPHGGASRRAGTKYIADAKHDDKNARLIAFIYNADQAYVLEFADQCIRFYADEGPIYSGATPYEIPSPYTEDQVDDIAYCQSADVMYLAHQNVAPMKLSRTGHTSWSLATVSFTSGTADIDVSTAWSGATQPGSVTFFEQRLTFAGSPNYPQTLWLSKSGDFENFTIGTNDDDAMIYTISSDYINPIHWLVPHNVLHVGTLGSLWTCGARSVLDPLTPTNVKFEREATYGAMRHQARVIGGAVVFMGRSGKKIMEQSYSLQADGLQVRDLTLLANHITGSGVIEYDWAQDPDHTLWALRSDGILISGTYYPPEQVMGWCGHDTRGLFKSLAVIPYVGRDQLWVLTQRDINGTTKKFIELMQDPEVDEAKDAFFVDCGLTFNDPQTLSSPSTGDPMTFTTGSSHGWDVGDYAYLSGFSGTTAMKVLPAGRYTLATGTTGTTIALSGVNGANYDGGMTCGIAEHMVTSLSGADWLAGMTVSVLADGSIHPDVTVTSGGSISLSRPCAKVTFGLPYTSVIETMSMEAGVQDGTAQARKKKIPQVAVRLYNSLGLDVSFDGYDPVKVPFRDKDDPMDTAIPLFTGDKSINVPGGWSLDGRIKLASSYPLPLTVLGIYPKVKVNE